jgi:hypothetical protein
VTAAASAQAAKDTLKWISEQPTGTAETPVAPVQPVPSANPIPPYSEMPRHPSFKGYYPGEHGEKIYPPKYDPDAPRPDASDTSAQPSPEVTSAPSSSEVIVKDLPIGNIKGMVINPSGYTNRQIMYALSRGAKMPGYHLEKMPEYGGKGIYLPNQKIQMMALIDERTGQAIDKTPIDPSQAKSLARMEADEQHERAQWERERLSNYGGGRRSGSGFWRGNHSLYHGREYFHGMTNVKIKIG